MATYDSGYALVVGVGADLPATLVDAARISTWLTGDSCGYPADNVRTLTAADATADGMRAGMRWLADKATGPNSTAVVYYSGHATRTGGERLHTQGESLPAAEFTELLSAIQSKRLLVLLDCCHAGAQGQLEKSALPLDVGTVLSAGEGRVLLASSRSDQTSLITNASRPNSVFTKALLEGLSGQCAADYDGFVRVLDLAMWTAQRVPILSQFQQQPVLKVKDLSGNFAIGYYAGGDVQTKSLIDVQFPRIGRDVGTLVRDGWSAAAVHEGLSEDGFLDEVAAMNSWAALEYLLVSLMRPDGFDGFVRRGYNPSPVKKPKLLGQLPNPNAGGAQDFFSDVIDVLKKQGLLRGPNFFKALASEFPGRETDIAAVAALWDVT